MSTSRAGSLVKETHPSIARSIALAACRTVDPEGTARRYLKNYDHVVRTVRRTNPDVAHVVALQTCRSNDEKIWDQAAGTLIIEEAGGRVTDKRGATLDFGAGRLLVRNEGVVASNEHLHAAVLDALRGEAGTS